LRCHLEWGLPAGHIYLPMHTRMLLPIPIHIPTPAPLTQCGRGGVAEDEAEVVDSAGAGLCPIGTAGGKTRNERCVRR
jgi:hypothetical protein